MLGFVLATVVFASLSFGKKPTATPEEAEAVASSKEQKQYLANGWRVGEGPSFYTKHLRLMRGDVLFEANGLPFTGSTKDSRILRAHINTGKKVSLRYLRDGQILTKSVLVDPSEIVVTERIEHGANVLKPTEPSEK